MQEDFGFDQLGNTHIIVDIYYAMPNIRVSVLFGILGFTDTVVIILQTSGHNWHVHRNRTQVNTDCVRAIAGHYNPFMVSLGKSNC